MFKTKLLSATFYSEVFSFLNCSSRVILSSLSEQELLELEHEAGDWSDSKDFWHFVLHTRDERSMSEWIPILQFLLERLEQIQPSQFDRHCTPFVMIAQPYYQPQQIDVILSLRRMNGEFWDCTEIRNQQPGIVREVQMQFGLNSLLYLEQRFQTAAVEIEPDRAIQDWDTPVRTEKRIPATSQTSWNVTRYLNWLGGAACIAGTALLLWGGFSKGVMPQPWPDPEQAWTDPELTYVQHISAQAVKYQQQGRMQKAEQALNDLLADYKEGDLRFEVLLAVGDAYLSMNRPAQAERYGRLVLAELSRCQTCTEYQSGASQASQLIDAAREQQLKALANSQSQPVPPGAEP